MSSIPSKFTGYAAKNAEDGKQNKVAPIEFDPAPLGDDDVTVEVEYCGLCYSDLHVMHQDWGKTPFPFVGGHEVVGKVAELGKLVKGLEKGQRVGIGWLSGACRACSRCIRAKDEFCAEKEETIINRHGGFADFIRVNAHYAFPIPENLKPEDAAPLMCAGITVFTPLKHYGVQPFHRVGIVGMGGLGHLAVQFAAAMGCEVTVFSHSPKKKDEAKEFGATNFVSTADKEAMKKSTDTQDFILVTTDKIDEETFDALLSCLDIDGKICIVGDMGAKLSMATNVVAQKRLSICGSIIGGQVDIQDMLQFVTKHEVRPKINQYPMSKIGEALQAMEEGKARYRIVLKRESDQ